MKNFIYTSRCVLQSYSPSPNCKLVYMCIYFSKRKKASNSNVELMSDLKRNIQLFLFRNSFHGRTESPSKDNGNF